MEILARWDFARMCGDWIRAADALDELRELAKRPKRRELSELGERE